MGFFDANLLKVLSSGGAGTIIGGVAGALGKAFWVRWIEERTLPTPELLNRLQSGKVTAYGRGRLQNEGREMLEFWRRSRPAPAEGLKVPRWPDTNLSVQNRPPSYGENGSPCPQTTNRGAPMFINLDNDSVERLVAELEADFEMLDKQFPPSRALISQLEFVNSSTPPCIWISCLNILCRTTRDVELISQRLWSEIRKILPSASVVIELCVPSGIIADDGIIPRGSVASPTRPAARYVFLRDEAARRLAEGLTFGDLVGADREVPPQLIGSRLQGPLRAAVDNPGSWKTIAISGPPGSGKTDVARLLMQELERNRKIITLTASTAGILEAIRTLPDAANIEASFQLLADAIGDDGHIMVPQILRTTEDWKEPFIDALRAILKARTHEILIVVDDLHIHSDIAAAVARLRGSSLPYRFLLISRSGVRSVPGEHIVNYDCRLWSRPEAAQMLRFWVSEANRPQTDRALTNGWPEKQESFSLYLLRAMAEYIDSLESAPSELLNKAIRGHLSPISQMLTLEQEPPTIVLERIRHMLADPNASRDEIIDAMAERTEIEPVLVIGILAWYTSFAPPEPGATREHRAFLDSERVLQFSRGLVSSREQAEQILETGAQAKIFDKSRGAFRNVYGWRDKLIADGCAALYLASQIDRQRLDDRSIANCVESLDEKRSLDILALALDTTLLVKIIAAVAATRPNLAQSVNRLFTSEVADRLSRIAGTLEEVGDKLFDLSSSIDLAQLVHVARALAKVMRFSQTFTQECWELILRSSDRAMPALAAMATDYSDNDGYFTMLRDHRLPEFMNPVALEAAARVWTAGSWPVLSTQAASLLEAGCAQERIESIWVVWCGGHTTEEVLKATVGLIEAALVVRRDVFLSFAATTLKHVITSRSPAERNRSRALLTEVARQLSAAAKAGYHRPAAELVRWLAVHHGPDIVNSGTEWIVSRNGTSAFPRAPVEIGSVANLLALIRPVREWFRLASSDELKSLRTLNGFELVRDALGDNFSYESDDLMVGQIRAWDGKEVVVVPKWQVNAGPFTWRPRFSIPT
jgi:hypothetical protein